MGIVKAAVSSVRDVAKEQWKEFFYCESIPDEILLVRGVKHISERSSNDRRDDEVITPGSIIALADGQGALVVSQGKIIAQYTEPGEHIYENPEQPAGLKGFLKETGTRISFGGGLQTTSQRVYYFNTKEIRGIPFDTRVPVTLTSGGFQSVLSAGGVFSYRVCSPPVFYKMVTGNVAIRYERSRLNSQLVTELVTSLSRVVSRTELPSMSDTGLHTDDFITSLKADLNNEWREKRGLELVSVAFGSLEFEGSGAISNIQMTKVFANSGEWTCRCKAVCSGNFCPECGSKKPEGWVCECGQENKGNFCINCGKERG